MPFLRLSFALHPASLTSSLCWTALAFVLAGVAPKLSNAVETAMDSVISRLRTHTGDQSAIARLKVNLDAHAHGCFDASNPSTLQAWLRRQTGEFPGKGPQPLSVARLLQVFYFDQQRVYRAAFTRVIEAVHQQLQDQVSRPTHLFKSELAEWVQQQRAQPSSTALHSAALQSFGGWFAEFKEKTVRQHMVLQLRSKLDLAMVQLQDEGRQLLAGLVAALPASLMEAVETSGQQAPAAAASSLATSDLNSQQLPVAWKLRVSNRKKAVAHIIDFLTCSPNVTSLQRLLSERVINELQKLSPKLEQIQRELLDHLRVLLQEAYMHHSRLTHLSPAALQDLETLNQALTQSGAHPNRIVFSFEIAEAKAREEANNWRLHEQPSRATSHHTTLLLPLLQPTRACSCKRCFPTSGNTCA